MRFTSTLVVAVGLFAAIPSAISTIIITGPSTTTYWVQDSANNITWEFTPGDPSPVTITVTNPNSTSLNGAFYIAENVDLANKSFTVTNVTLNVHDGYMVNFVNGSNPTQIYAQSGAFSLMSPGTPRASQATASAASATGTSPVGGSSNGSSGSTSATSASSTPSNKTNSSLRSFDGSFMTLVTMFGMSVLMSVVGALATF